MTVSGIHDLVRRTIPREVEEDVRPAGNLLLDKAQSPK